MNPDNDIPQESAMDTAGQAMAMNSSEGASDKLAVDLLKRGPTTIEDVTALRAAAFSSPRAWDNLECYIRSDMEESEPDYDQKCAVGLATLGLYELAEEKLESLKDLPLAACLLGRIYKETGRPDKAVEIFRKIHERVSEVKVYHILLIDALEAADDLDCFRRELEMLESKQPEDPHTLYFKGVSLEKDGAYDKAKELYLQAVEKDPNLACAHFRIAYRMDLMGMEEEAISYYKRCIESGPSNVAALVNMGIIYDDQERYDEAMVCYHQVLVSTRTTKELAFF